MSDLRGLTAKRLIGSVAVAGLLSTGAVAAVALTATPAGAATIDINDFRDPVTGQIDLEAYLAAVAAANASSGGGEQAAAVSTGSLPYTGSDTQDLLIGGVAVLVTGGAAALIASRKRGAASGTTSPGA